MQEYKVQIKKKYIGNRYAHWEPSKEKDHEHILDFLITLKAETKQKALEQVYLLNTTALTCMDIKIIEEK